MTNTEKYVPKHRAPGKHKAKRDPLASLRVVSSRPALAVTGLAVAVTGVSVAGGVLGGEPTPSTVAAADSGAGVNAQVAALAAESVADRAEKSVTRSDRRDAVDQTKAALLGDGAGVVTAHERKLSDQDPRDIARTLMGDFGFADSQFSCLDSLWTKESGWRWNADNPSSSAYGIPQALPGSKMASAGADWATNPATQISWGLGYIKSRYGSPCSAWGHSQAVNWY
ncbi:lytic transglycosylase domain-containing protein [Nocardioides yefusunii]|uniref:Lytic transglycosylase domain-containing protein n=1 Tax=Nocardioides yefusunii TaxID=2500546 RepID=A0ABW1QWB9_9ACTN|nr:lytic transglycosylase domain-containing protein [Nocardioides yefusunii]